MCDVAVVCDVTTDVMCSWCRRGLTSPEGVFLNMGCCHHYHNSTNCHCVRAASEKLNFTPFPKIPCFLSKITPTSTKTLVFFELMHCSRLRLAGIKATSAQRGEVRADSSMQFFR